MPRPERDYGAIVTAAAASRDGSRDERLARAVELFWELLGPRGVSWIGFYDKVEGADEMVLVCRAPKPACSPIGLHGMCGRSWSTRRPIVIDDVRTLGAGYIACDPKDQSEVVLPLVDEDGTCRGVLDADSHDPASFDERDVVGMQRVLEALRLTIAPSSPVLRL